MPALVLKLPTLLLENLHCELFKKKIIVQNAGGDLGQGGSGLDPSSGLPPLLLS